MAAAGGFKGSGLLMGGGLQRVASRDLGSGQMAAAGGFKGSGLLMGGSLQRVASRDLSRLRT